MSKRELTGRTRYNVLNYGLFGTQRAVVLQVEERWNEQINNGNEVRFEPILAWRNAQPLDLFENPRLEKGRKHRLMNYGFPLKNKSAYVLQVERVEEDMNFMLYTVMRDALPADAVVMLMDER